MTEENIHLQLLGDLFVITVLSTIVSGALNRLALRLSIVNGNMNNTTTFIQLLINNSGLPASRLYLPAAITVPEISKPVILALLMVIMPVLPAIVGGRYRKKGRSVVEEFGLAWRDLMRQI